MKKWLASIECGLTVAAFAFTIESEAAFKDLPEDNYFSPYVYDLVERGQINGYPDRTFRTNNPITRAEASQLLATYGGRYYPIDEAMARYENEGYELYDLYPDVPKGVWFFNAVYSLASDSIVNGFPDGKFYPNSFLTRAEAAKIIRGMIDLRVPADSELFEDIEGHFAEEDIKKLASIGLFLGKDGKRFAPDDLVTRGELAVMIYRLNTYEDLILAGETVGVQKSIYVYDEQWLYEHVGDEMLNDEQPTYLIQAKDLKTFLQGLQFEGPEIEDFEVDESKSYLATHFVDAVCPHNVAIAKLSERTLTINQIPSMIEVKHETGEDYACLTWVQYGLELIEVPANLPIAQLLKTQLPYRFETNFNYVDVLPYEGTPTIY